MALTYIETKNSNETLTKSSKPGTKSNSKSIKKDYLGNNIGKRNLGNNNLSLTLNRSKEKSTLKVSSLNYLSRQRNL